MSAAAKLELAVVGTAEDLTTIEKSCAPDWLCRHWQPATVGDSNPVAIVRCDGSTQELPDASHIPHIYLLPKERLPEASALASKGKWVAVRSNTLPLQLAILAENAKRHWHRTQFETTILGPIGHEVRGAVGVIDLACQLLSQKGVADATTSKLRTAGRRIRVIMQDIGLLARLRLSDSSHEDDQASEESLEERLELLQRLHRGRELSVSGDLERAKALPPSQLLPLVGGVVDAASSASTGGKISVHFEATPSGLTVSCRLDRAELSPGMRDQMGSPIHLWVSRRDVPHRLVTAALLARSLGGSVTMSEADGVVVEATAPWPS